MQNEQGFHAESSDGCNPGPRSLKSSSVPGEPKIFGMTQKINNRKSFEDQKIYSQFYLLKETQ